MEEESQTDRKRKKERNIVRQTGKTNERTKEERIHNNLYSPLRDGLSHWKLITIIWFLCLGSLAQKSRNPACRGALCSAKWKPWSTETFTTGVARTQTREPSTFEWTDDLPESDGYWNVRLSIFVSNSSVTYLSELCRHEHRIKCQKIVTGLNHGKQLNSSLLWVTLTTTKKRFVCDGHSILR